MRKTAKCKKIFKYNFELYLKLNLNIYKVNH